MSRGYAAKGIRERIHTVRLDEAYRLIRRRHRDRPLGTIPTPSRFSDPQSGKLAVRDVTGLVQHPKFADVLIDYEITLCSTEK